MDQYTYDLVKAIVTAYSSMPVTAIYGISGVIIESGEASIDGTKLEMLPQKTEERIFSGINCGDLDEPWNREVTIVTQRSYTTEMTTTVSSSTESTLKVAIPGGPLQVNGDLIQKNGVVVTSRESRTFSETVTESVPDQRERTLKPHSALYIKVVIVKGLVKAPISGTVVLDALIDATVMLGSISLTRNWSLSELCREPRFRTTAINGVIYSESYERYDVLINRRDVASDDPICKVGAQNLPFRVNAGSRNGVRYYDGSVETGRKIGTEYLWSGGDAIHIRVQNDDSGDLFVWVWDKNEFGGKAVLEGERINAGQARPVDIRANGDGVGVVAWRAVRSDDMSRVRSEDNVPLGNGDRLDVRT